MGTVYSIHRPALTQQNKAWVAAFAGMSDGEVCALLRNTGTDFGDTTPIPLPCNVEPGS
jgi:hypothetical protein